MVFEEDGMTTEHGHRPDLDWPELRGGVGPCELKALIFHIRLAVKSAVKDGYQFAGP